MGELHEVSAIRQVPGEPRRRWFAATSMDLLVWVDDAGAPIGFQLAYDKPHAERALTWHAGRGIVQTRVDTGEQEASLGYKRAPILVADGVLDADAVAERFHAAAGALPADVRDFVLDKLAAHPR